MKRCKHCGEGPMEVSRGIQLKPLGTFSLAGAQLKASAYDTLKLSCADCGLYAFGWATGLEVDDGGKVTAGTFHATEVHLPDDRT
jgi:hypothetical protein